MRSYDYNQDDFQDLFVRVVEKLSAPADAGNLIASTLTEICQHFLFGIGVVYEMDHAGVLHLKESYLAHKDIGMRHTIRLAKEASPNAESVLEEVLNTPVYISLSWTGEQFQDTEIYHIFGVNSILLIPILDDEKQLIGLVGMMDRRHNILAHEQDVHVAETVLRLLANYVKLRIYQRRVEMAQQSLISTLDNTGIDIYVNDFHTHEILYVNRTMAEPYGGLDKMLGKKCWQVLYSDKKGQCDYCPQPKLIDEQGFPTKVYSWDYQRPFDGSWFRVFSAAFKWVDGRLAHVVSSVDITENKRNESLVVRMATVDALTNLPNRRKLFSDFALAEKKFAQEGNAACLMFFDLDNFKSINDTFGHQIGDELLKEVARTLLDNPVIGGHVYRHGGDEFVIFFDNAAPGDVDKTVDLLLSIFEKPWLVGEHEITCRSSIGVAVYPDDGRCVEELIHSADMMMYEAKRQGKGTACFRDGHTVVPKS